MSKLLVIVLCIAVVAPAAPHQNLTANITDKDGAITIPAGKCEDLAPSNCADHCRSLRRELAGGECENGTCYCRLDIADILRSALGGKVKKNASEVKSEGRPSGVECKNLIRLRSRSGTENHRGCAVHCRLNDLGNKDRRCVEGICQCSRVALQETTTKPDDRKKEEKDDDEDEKVKCRSRSECSIRCQKSKYNDGECVAGRCRCSTADAVARNQLHEIPDNLKRKVTRCERRSEAANEELCREHCEAFSKDHTEGRCVGGVCRCGYAVFEFSEYPEDTNYDRDWRERKTESPKSQRIRAGKPNRY